MLYNQNTIQLKIEHYFKVMIMKKTFLALGVTVSLMLLSGCAGTTGGTYVSPGYTTIGYGSGPFWGPGYYRGYGGGYYGGGYGTYGNHWNGYRTGYGYNNHWGNRGVYRNGGFHGGRR